MPVIRLLLLLLILDVIIAPMYDCSPILYLYRSTVLFTVGMVSVAAVCRERKPMLL
jgi:hypothetical protein